MIAKPADNPRYRPSRGRGQFRLPSGQEILMWADDEEIEAEMRRRGLWATAQQNAALGQSFVLTQTSSVGVDLFVWIGDADDGGFIWYSLPGAKKIPHEIVAVIAGAFRGPVPAFEGGFSYGLS